MLRLGFYCISPEDKISWVPKQPSSLYKIPRLPSLWWIHHAPFPGIPFNYDPKMPVCKQICKIKPWHFKKLFFPSTFRSLRDGIQQCIPLGVIKANAWIFFKNLTENTCTNGRTNAEESTSHAPCKLSRLQPTKQCSSDDCISLLEGKRNREDKNPQSLTRLNFLTLLWTDYTDFVD